MNNQRQWIFLCIIIATAVILVSHIGSTAVTAMNEREPIERSCIVVIDAGHGGEDGGALSVDGIPESVYNLSIALRLEKVMHLLGIETQMVRNQDISVYTEGSTLQQKKRSDLKERVRIVNDLQNSVLLSIHQNYFSDERYHGAQVFYAGTKGSKSLATDLQAAFRSTIHSGSNREAKLASGIYLMEHIHRPGVLIECGFLSNSQEAHLLQDSDYQKKLACLIAVTAKHHLAAVNQADA